MSLKKTDSKIAELIKKEEKRQQNQLQMIPSENHVSEAIKEAVGSVLMNKYSEGQAFKRYYQGNVYIDEIEALAKERALKLFGLNQKVWDVNVQAATGSAANMAVYFALLEPGDKIMSMYLYDGGHLSHGWKLPNGKKVSMTSKIFNSVFYQVEQNSKVFDYKKIKKLAMQEKPKIIISGGTAYPREIDHKKMAKIAKDTNAYYLADIAHEAGLVAAKVNSSPFEHADVVTMTTRKTLRGPIGALIFAKKSLIDQINKAVFPGLQGGPLNHSIAGIAVALKEASSTEFVRYARQTVKNSQTLAKELSNLGYDIVSGGTDKHLVLVDLRNKNTDGWLAAWALEHAGIIVNRNTVPFDTGSPFYPSGLRLGTPAITTRGMDQKEMKIIAKWIDSAIKIALDVTPAEIKSDKKQARIKARAQFKEAVSKSKDLKKIAQKVKELCKDFPTP